jgi:protoporphyrinogen oxidase
MTDISSLKKIVVAGAGMTGLMCALQLRKEHPNKPIVVFDKSTHIGGMYSSIEYDTEGYIFDHGMHVIYESCNAKIDNLYREIMPIADWHIYEGNEKDIAGLFFNGKLQDFSHYVDLRLCPKEQWQSYIADFFTNLEQNSDSDSKTAMEYLRAHFGRVIAEDIHSKLLSNLYKIDPEVIDIFAIKATALERVIMFDKELMIDLMKSDFIRTRLAFPDQINLPPYRANTQKALYPKKFGMQGFLNRFRDKLHEQNIEILTGVDIQKLQCDNSHITHIKLSNTEKSSYEIPVETLVWTAGWSALASSLNMDISDLKFQRGPRIIYINLVLDRPPIMGRLYYFYCYDSGFGSFRVTSYSNYCPNACQDGKYPVCVEFWPSRIGLNADETTDEQLIQLAIGELKEIGIIQDHQVIFAKAENLKSEFPLPSIVNTKNLQEIRTRISKENIKNLTVAGIMAEDGLFFISDILNDAFKKISKISQAED